MARNRIFFTTILCLIMATTFVESGSAVAAPASRASVRSNSVARKPATSSLTTTTKNTATTASVETKTIETTTSTPEPKQELIIENKSSEFELAVSNVLESASNDNSFAEQIRKQRAALAASDASIASANAQKNAMATNSNTCDRGLRKCMQQKCGNDFTKCALDGDTIFGDKLNACRRDIECTGEEFNLFVNEIRSDRDMNVRLASYNNVINCGNQYNACIVNECGTTYSKCLGKANENAAIQKCATIAKECTESDSGLANRFSTAIGKLRETAEKEVKADEERMYALRDSMSGICKKLGAMFDERFFDCVFTVNFFAGKNQTEPTASRKRFAGDTFACNQEWFGINATTYKENAYRETRAQKAASSAMLGGGVGTAVGLVTSGAIGRSLDTQKAKKDLKSECKGQGGEMKNGKCINSKTGKEIKVTNSTENATPGSDGNEGAEPQDKQENTPSSDTGANGTPETSTTKKIQIDTRLPMQQKADEEKARQADVAFGGGVEELKQKQEEFKRMANANKDIYNKTNQTPNTENVKFDGNLNNALQTKIDQGIQNSLATKPTNTMGLNYTKPSYDKISK